MYIVEQLKCSTQHRFVEASTDRSETLSTLRFGTRAKAIKNNAVINAQRSSEELTLLLRRAEQRAERLAAVVARLEAELGNGGGVSTAVSDDDAQQRDEQHALALVECEDELAVARQETAAANARTEAVLKELIVREEQLEEQFEGDIWLRFFLCCFSPKMVVFLKSQFWLLKMMHCGLLPMRKKN